jgi:hypothetical protein
MQAPTISLPKDSGAIHGMGKNFAANPVTGTGAMTVPLATSPGRGGFGPHQLTLSYDSGSGNGPFDFGCGAFRFPPPHAHTRFIRSSITGHVIDIKTQESLAGLRVEVWDKGQRKKQLLSWGTNRHPTVFKKEMNYE